jgi:methionine sulfoxide reductase catalytic subunit
MRFVEKQPKTTWQVEWPEAYGFYSNVNPNRDHPGHSQKYEFRLGEGLFEQKRDTILFNGYSNQVASLYPGMDLRKNY